MNLYISMGEYLRILYFNQCGRAEWEAAVRDRDCHGNPFDSCERLELKPGSVSCGNRPKYF
jgi:hypothetical protein